MNQPLLTLLSGIKQLLSKKQDKLIAGENVTIDENNVINASGSSNAVLFTEQTLTAEQKTKARNNISAESAVTRLQYQGITELELADNTEYYLTDIADLTLTFPAGSFECWISLTTVTSGTVNVTLPPYQYIGSIRAFRNNETWEISIKNGVVVAAKVGDGA